MRKLIISLLFLFQSCALTNVNHLSSTNWLDRKITPNHRTGQWLMTPVYIPACVLTLSIDNFLIAPAVHLPKTYRRSEDYLFHDFGYYTNMGTLPIRIALLPVFSVSYWMLSTVFVGDSEYWPEWGKQWERDMNGKLLGPIKEKTDEDIQN